MKKGTPQKHLIKCKVCGKGFEKAVQLGGHVSKAHPGTSVAYIRKCATRENRTKDREMRVKAREWFVDTTGLCPAKHRVHITEIKKQMLRGLDP